MIVVAIVGVLASIASVGMSRSKERQTVRQEITRLRSAVEKARTLSAQAGSRLGSPRLVMGPAPCLPAPSGDANNLWISFIPGPPLQARVPMMLVPNPATDVTTVMCETIQLGLGTVGYNATEALGIGAGSAFAFTATGRIVGDVGTPLPAAGVHVVLTQGDDVRRYGFRVLPSGLVCDSSDNAPVAGAPLCDEDR